MGTKLKARCLNTQMLRLSVADAFPFPKRTTKINQPKGTRKNRPHHDTDQRNGPYQGRHGTSLPPSADNGENRRDDTTFDVSETEEASLFSSQFTQFATFSILFQPWC